MLSLPREALEEFVAKARQEEDEIRTELRQQRWLGFRSWCLAESEGGMRALARWVKDGPRSMQSTGVYLKEGRLYAGQRALLEASEQAWWPLWKQPQGSRWDRVVPPRADAGWQVAAFEAAWLMRLAGVMARTKARA